ncbi:MAG: hypothetical protein VX589_01305 [Myxococcota bacterium]|nr:hypothetical protein [Myxococcota bacterium]
MSTQDVCVIAKRRAAKITVEDNHTQYLTSAAMKNLIQGDDEPRVVPKLRVINEIALSCSVVDSDTPLGLRALYNRTQRHDAFDFVGSHTHGAFGYPDRGWDEDNEGWPG